MNCNKPTAVGVGGEEMEVESGQLMHIAWLGKKSPFCGNVTYSREVTQALLSRGHRVSFFHFADDPATSSPFSPPSSASFPPAWGSTLWPQANETSRHSAHHNDQSSQQTLNSLSSPHFFLQDPTAFDPPLWSSSNPSVYPGSDPSAHSLWWTQPPSLPPSRSQFPAQSQPESTSEAPAESQDVSLPYLYKSQIYTIPNPKAVKVLTQALRDLTPDLVHASLILSPMDFVLPEICRNLNLPLVATFHPGFDTRRWNLVSHTQHLMYQIYAPALADYDCTIVFSQQQRDILLKLGLSPLQVHQIPNGVDPEKFSPGSSSIKHELAADRLFVYQGRIALEKNIEALLKAWKQAQLGSRAKLVMVGDGPLLPLLKTLYTSQHGVIWMGYVADQQRRIEILRGADVFVLPSLIEGLSLSLLEAMACGVAVVATGVGADGEVLADGAGILLEPQRVTPELLTLLPLLRDHPEFTQLLGVKARRRVLERYTLATNISQLEQVYQNLVSIRQMRVG